jgi:hypothetical protein
MSNLNRLFRDIEKQNAWADEIARRPSHHNPEPLDSQRRLLQRDDKTHD